MVCGGGGGLRGSLPALLPLPPRAEPGHAAHRGYHPYHLPPGGPGLHAPSYMARILVCLVSYWLDYRQ